MANSVQNVVIGKRQILRELKKGNIAEIQIAVDAETEYITFLIDCAKAHGVSYRLHSTMDQIALQHGIEVPSGAVGVLKA